MRVVHYLNQFFGRIGGEEQAGAEPRGVDGPVGPGVALQRALGQEGTVVRTLICGDNYFGEHQEEATERLLSMLRDARADLLVAGPAFSAGRYGLTCTHLCQEARSRLGLAAVTGAAPDNPAVETYRREVVIVPTGQTPATMDRSLAKMVALGLKLARGEELGPPETEGYLPQGFRRNVVVERTGAERAIAMLHAKLAGKPYSTEIPLPEFKEVPAAPPVADLSRTIVALVTSGGLVPKGNPDRLKSHVADCYGRYSIAGMEGLKAGEFEGFHGGYFTAFVNQDPNRMVPLDALRAMVKEGVLGGVHPTLYTIAGNGTSPAVVERMAREIAPELLAAGVGGVLITSA